MMKNWIVGLSNLRIFIGLAILGYKPATRGLRSLKYEVIVYLRLRGTLKSFTLFINVQNIEKINSEQYNKQ